MQPPRHCSQETGTPGTKSGPFAKTYGTKLPKAVAKIADDQEELLAFYDFPAEHWIHLRTTNPIESTFSTVKLRTKVTHRAGSPAAALATVFKLVESAQARWRDLRGSLRRPRPRGSEVRERRPGRAAGPSRMSPYDAPHPVRCAAAPGPQGHRPPPRPRLRTVGRAYLPE